MYGEGFNLLVCYTLSLFYYPSQGKSIFPFTAILTHANLAFCHVYNVSEGDLMVVRKDKKRLVLEKAFVVPEHEHQE